MGWWEKADEADDEADEHPRTPLMLTIATVLAIPVWWGMLKLLGGLFW